MASSKALLTVSLAVASLARPSLSQTPDDTTVSHPLHPHENAPYECGLYLAPSGKLRRNQPERWGVYAGRTYQAADAIGAPEVAFDVHAFRAHSTAHEDDEEDDDDDEDDEQDLRTRLADTLLNHVWQPEIIGASDEVPDEQGGSEALVPGAGLLADFDTSIANANWDVRASFQRVTVGDAPGLNHPGRGANSPFYNVVLRAMKDIQPGEEIILNFDMGVDTQAMEYQDLELDEDGEVNPETNILEEDYSRIDQTVEQLLEFFQKHDKSVDEHGKLQIYRFMTDDFLEAAVGPIKAMKIAALLPSHPKDLADVKKAGGIKQYSLTSSKGGVRYRSLDWLERNGMCMDHIRAGPSNIPHAGRGAFATRSIPRDGLIAPTPLFVIPDKASMDMYDLEEIEPGIFHRENDQARGKQMLLNYMYSHPQSTVAFVPLGATVNLINHSNEPNAKLQWSNHPLHTADYMDVPPEELLHYQPIALVMEIVALRDIEPGEEITIDYGNRWKEAWELHVQNFEDRLATNTIDGSLPLRASDLNAQQATDPVRTWEEQRNDPYPEDVAIKLFMFFEDDDVLTDGSQEHPYIFEQPDEQTIYSDDDLVEPEILQRSEMDGVYVYSVRYVEENSKDEIYVTNVPQSAFVFVDKPETGDQFLPEPFRHYIEIPDDVFPQGPWRNLA